MTWLEVSEGHWLNTDHIAEIRPSPNQGAVLVRIGARDDYLELSPTEAHSLLKRLKADPLARRWEPIRPEEESAKPYPKEVLRGKIVDFGEEPLRRFIPPRWNLHDPFERGHEAEYDARAPDEPAQVEARPEREDEGPADLARRLADEIRKFRRAE